MSKLYPPTIEASLPAIYTKDENIIITVPFRMNSAVKQQSAPRIAINIKTIATNLFIGEFTTMLAYFENSDK
jgi:hypothetical protein